MSSNDWKASPKCSAWDDKEITVIREAHERRDTHSGGACFMTETIRILIIDDEESFTFFVKLNLETDPRFKVTTVSRGEEGLKIAKADRPDLILLDMMMPGMFGTEVAQKLQDDSRTKDIPIIFLTAAIKKEKVENETGLIGGREVIAKPVAKDELIGRIETTLKNAKHRE
jgi:two-component system, OmpR family, alkaline phosphatase synthesis response regulator PhoP